MLGEQRGTVIFGIDVIMVIATSRHCLMRPFSQSDQTTDLIIGAFFHVYNDLRFGFLEAVYANALAIELRERGLQVEREVPVDVYYRGIAVGKYRVDLLVDGRIVVEVKACKSLDPSARFQTLNYLRAMNRPVGLLLHFGPRPSVQRVELDVSRVARPRQFHG